MCAFHTIFHAISPFILYYSKFSCLKTVLNDCYIFQKRSACKERINPFPIGFDIISCTPAVTHLFL